MSNWFLLALIAPILWSFVNHIDKHILSKHQEGRGVGSILIFSALSSILVIPFVFLFHRDNIFNISTGDFFVFVIIGFLSAGAFYLYLKAMDIEEASVVVPLFQFDPIFGYILGYFVLSESLQLPQILSAVLVIIGIIVLSLDIDEANHISLKKRVLLYVSGSSFLFALSGVLFKKFALADSFWVSIFWQYVGLVIFGLMALVISKKFREDFLNIFRNPKANILTLNIVSEILYIIGGIANNFAVLIAPVALVFVVNSYQALFVFLTGIMLTTFLPNFTSEKLGKKHLFHKFLSIIIILIGSYLLYSSSIH